MAKRDEIEILQPRENPNLFGHDAAEQRFLQDFAREKLHHAYLIAGPKGIGKATMAFRLARFILSQGALSVTVEQGPSLFGDVAPPPPAPEGLAIDPESSLFRRIATGSHTDLLTLAPAFDAKKGTEKAQIGVDDARKVPEFLSLTPAEGAWRVVVVDAVDQLNTNAANALLKILEEPPANSILLLVCHELGGILPTIRSRCRLFPLEAPNRSDFERILQEVAPQIDLSDYPALYGLAYGSPGLAITLARHKGLDHYAGWLSAMQPTASAEERQRFADASAYAKSPDAWMSLMHGWNTAMHRLSLFPHYDRARPIHQREAAWLESITSAMPFARRQQWQESARMLVGATEIFNLDKRATVRLMLEPARLIRQFPAAA